MIKTSKKVNFCHLALQEGIRYRMELSEDNCLEGLGGGVFSFLAPVFDSTDEDGTWHRLYLTGKFECCKYEVIVAASNIDLREEIYQKEISDERRIEILKEHSWTRRVNTDDILLHGLTGRYLWVLIRVFGSRTDSSFQIEGFQVEFPKSSFVEYLPEIYQEVGKDTFFERYMAVLQSMYEDLEKEVDRIPEYLDYELTSDENLKMLSKWTGDWGRNQAFSPEQLRYIIRHLQQIQNGRGTKRVMKQMIHLATGREVKIVEFFRWHDWMRQREASSLLKEYEKLFGKNEDTFTVIIDMTVPGTEVLRETISRFLEDYTPLGMHCNVVLLGWSSHMDSHCYLDRNSCLSTPVKADAGGFVLGENYVLA